MLLIYRGILSNGDNMISTVSSICIIYCKQPNKNVGKPYHEADVEAEADGMLIFPIT